MGLVTALAWLLSAPVLGVPRMVHGIAKRVRNAGSQRLRSPAEGLLALRMRLETGEITEAAFQSERARTEAAGKERIAVRRNSSMLSGMLAAAEAAYLFIALKGCSRAGPRRYYVSRAGREMVALDKRKEKRIHGP